MRIPVLFLLACTSYFFSADTSTDTRQLRASQQKIDRLEASVRGVEAIRAVKRLQYAYGHYAEFGLWNDSADLFAEQGVGSEWK